MFHHGPESYENAAKAAAEFGRNKFQRLLDEGVEAIAVCLLNSFMNPVHERAVKDVIKSKVEDGARKFVINLEELEWMTSIGIGVLVESLISL